ncbi:MAG: aminopeptidase [Citrobacter freundii]|nr:MAG: aminopeptidase [Citrobacter freundii]
MRQRLICFILSITTVTSAFSQQITTGVSLELAEHRRAEISSIRYQLHFHIPAIKKEKIQAEETIRFTLKSNKEQLQLDFKQPVENIQSVSVNGKKLTPRAEQEHLIIPAAQLRKGANTIDISFIAGDASLNRNDDYLYALLVPDRARTVFPCFDQPDLKARFSLTLTVPAGWKGLGNGVLIDSSESNTQTTYRFKESDLLPTYLFSFTAGKFNRAAQQTGRSVAELLYRETDPGTNIDSIFQAHTSALRFLEEWTGIPYPFQKIGFAAIPDFQYGGMEHPGAVLYKASSLFLKEPTKDQLLGRQTLISHETAHMWFGDLVTMKWFNDVWMKEVFANFMADKVVEQRLGTETFQLKFVQDHYPAAYAVDRTAGGNPIRQQLENLQEAGTMYGSIIYHKAPIMMRQLEARMGKDNFQKGIREYLKTYANGNATWNDLIKILAKYSKEDLYDWNRVWVNEPGRPVFDYKIKYDGNKIEELEMTQQPERGTARIWPQIVTLALVYPDSVRSIQINMNKASLQIPELKGLNKPDWILFNADGMGYGLFPIDNAGQQKIWQLTSPVSRASAAINLYENVLAGRAMSPAEFITLLTEGLPLEKDETNLRLLTSYLGNLYWSFTAPDKRIAIAPQLEEAIWNAMQTQTNPGSKKVLFRAYQQIGITPTALGRLYEVWQTQQPPAGLRLAEDDYISLASTIALKNDTATSVLIRQRDRLKDEDKKARLSFLMPALSPNPARRDSMLNYLVSHPNEAKESWTTAALSYLHHPLRQQTAVKYLPKSLEVLEEVQRKGDIFYPQDWLSSIFGNYQTKEAWSVVEQFLKEHPAYNPRLKAKIEQSTDNLYRAQQLVP